MTNFRFQINQLNAMPILHQNDLLTYYLRYYDVITYITKINKNHPDNQRIKQIQIPSSLTQSIAFYFVLENPTVIGLTKINRDQLNEGSNRTFDLIYYSTRNINIEVKSTGSNTFQRFRTKALSANFVIWINFKEANKFDIAVFFPHILNPHNKKEVEIVWHELDKYGIIKYYRDRAL